MNVHDLILAEAPTTNEIVATTAKRRKAPAAPTWEVVLKDACDTAVRRKTTKTSRLLVLLMSKGQFYIKDEITGDVEQLTPKSLQAFMKGSADEPTKFVPWCSPLTSSLKGAERFCDVVANEDFQWLARRGLHVASYEFSGNRWWSDPDSATKLREKRANEDSPLRRALNQVCHEFVENPELLTEYSCSNDAEYHVYNLLDDVNYAIREMKYFCDKFGLDWTREYIRDFVTSPFVGAKLPNLSSYGDRLMDFNYEPGHFIEYLLHESVRQGYGQVRNARRRYGNADVEDFARLWGDTLRMEVGVRGKVYEKYPDNLEMLHRKLSLRMRIMDISVDEVTFAMHSERISALSKTDARYLIRPPFNKADMIDEATQQANCLASYVDAYANDQTDIYFLRRTDEPEKSLVTVEVRDGKVRQAYAACNRRPGKGELKWLEEWCKENNIQPIDADKQRPLCA